MNETKVETLIIGAGPAGLATAGRLTKMGMPFTMVEASDKIGYSWHNHYDRLHLHTVTEFSHLPYMPFPKHFPRYVPRKLFAEYLEDYARHFNIHVLFQERVSEIKANQPGFSVSMASGTTYNSDNVIIATGVNRVPFSPTWPNQLLFKGEISHSQSYKNTAPYTDCRVLVVGMGNTGAEIALDLAENNIPCLISVRGAVSVVPRDLHGRPTQVTAKLLDKLPFGFGDALGTFIRKLYYGDLSKYGLTASKMHPAEQLRKTGKTPIIDIGTIQKIKEGKITVVPEIKKFTPNGFIDVKGTKHLVDKVILATGYRAHLEDFLFSTEGLLDKFDVPFSPIGEERYKGLYFVGFDNYKLGGILGTIFTDSKRIVDDIAGGDS